MFLLGVTIFILNGSVIAHKFKSQVMLTVLKHTGTFDWFAQLVKIHDFFLRCENLLTFLVSETGYNEVLFMHIFVVLEFHIGTEHGRQAHIHFWANICEHTRFIRLLSRWRPDCQACIFVFVMHSWILREMFGWIGRNTQFVNKFPFFFSRAVSAAACDVTLV